VAGNKDAEKTTSPWWYPILVNVGLHCRWLHYCSNSSRFLTITFLQTWHSEPSLWQVQEWKAQLHLEWQREAVKGLLHGKVVPASTNAHE